MAGSSRPMPTKNAAKRETTADDGRCEPPVTGGRADCSNEREQRAARHRPIAPARPRRWTDPLASRSKQCARHIVHTAGRQDREDERGAEPDGRAAKDRPQRQGRLEAAEGDVADEWRESERQRRSKDHADCDARREPARGSPPSRRRTRSCPTRRASSGWRRAPAAVRRKSGYGVPHADAADDDGEQSHRDEELRDALDDALDLRRRVRPGANFEPASRKGLLEVDDRRRDLRIGRVGRQRKFCRPADESFGCDEPRCLETFTRDDHTRGANAAPDTRRSGSSSMAARTSKARGADANRHRQVFSPSRARRAGSSSAPKR